MLDKNVAPTGAKPAARKNVGTQAELPQKHVAVQVSGCSECWSLALAMEDGGDNACVRCEQINHLLNVVAERKEEVKRLRACQQGFKLGSKGEGEAEDDDNIRMTCGKWQEDISGLEGRDDGKDLQPVVLTHAVNTSAKARSCRAGPGTPEVIGDRRVAATKRLGGSVKCPFKKETWPADRLKCLYTNARSMGNKQEELEAVLLQESYDIVAITETWWDESYDWTVAIDGYKLFRRDRRERKGGGVALYV
ncbi:nipped-b-like protein [Limosa lapponica baueri]|uniref:Nipped-b-like protein n=1 Tax=Limosa lapponica baueri TaxID=1758121 RepID=A0A2I0URQ1_LIMLA|nr:nipped-b-like protein [Limosa lapponica baueri]